MLDSEPTAPRTCAWPSADAEGEEIGDLDPALFKPGLALRDWLLAEGARLESWDVLLAGLGGRDPAAALAWRQAPLGEQLGPTGARETFSRGRIET